MQNLALVTSSNFCARKGERGLSGFVMQNDHMIIMLL